MRGWFSQKNLKFKEIVLFEFVFFSCYYFSMDLKRQSEHWELCPDTSSFVSNWFSIYSGKLLPLNWRFLKFCQWLLVPNCDKSWIVVSRQKFNCFELKNDPVNQPSIFTNISVFFVKTHKKPQIGFWVNSFLK